MVNRRPFWNYFINDGHFEIQNGSTDHYYHKHCIYKLKTFTSALLQDYLYRSMYSGCYKWWPFWNPKWRPLGLWKKMATLVFVFRGVIRIFPESFKDCIRNCIWASKMYHKPTDYKECLSEGNKVDNSYGVSLVCIFWIFIGFSFDFQSQI